MEGVPHILTSPEVKQEVVETGTAEEAVIIIEGPTTEVTEAGTIILISQRNQVSKERALI